MTRKEQFEELLEKHGVFENPMAIKNSVWEYVCQRVDEYRKKRLYDTAQKWEIAERIIYEMLDEEIDDDIDEDDDEEQRLVYRVAIEVPEWKIETDSIYYDENKAVDRAKALISLRKNAWVETYVDFDWNAANFDDKEPVKIMKFVIGQRD